MLFIPLLLKLVSPLKLLSVAVRVAILLALVMSFVWLGGVDAVAASPTSPGAGANPADTATTAQMTPSDGLSYQQDEPDGDNESDGDGPPVNPPDWLVDNDEEEDEDPYESVKYEFQSGLNVHKVEYDSSEDVARVYLSADSDVRDVLLVDGTRTESGSPNTLLVDLSEGEQQVYELDLANTRHQHISIWHDREPYYDFGGGSLRTSDTIDYPIVLAPIAAGLTLVLLVGLHNFTLRRRDSAKNPLE